jgi:hypothetical protein
VLVFLYGGNDAFNTWVPYTDETYYRVRPTLAVPRDSVLKITDQHGFHPSLAALMPAWEAKDLALVQGIGYPAGHPAALPRLRDRVHRATTRRSAAGTAGSRACSARRRADALADAIAFGDLDIASPIPMGPSAATPGVSRCTTPDESARQAPKIADCALETNPRPASSRARHHAIPVPPLKTAFPAIPSAGDAHDGGARRADRNLPVIHVTLNGLDDDKHHSVDCHWDQLKYHGDALKRLADGLAALRSGLGDRPLG